MPGRSTVRWVVKKTHVPVPTEHFDTVAPAMDTCNLPGAIAVDLLARGP